MVICSNHHASIHRNGKRPNGGAYLRYELTATGIGCQVPNADVASLVAGDEFTLYRF